MQRREFCQWFGVGCLASYFPVALAACTGNEGTSTTAPTPGAKASARSDGFVAVGTVADLDGANGQILNKEAAKEPILVIRNPADPKSAIAVNPTCPHKQCPVGWQASNKTFACPCHGSEFAPDGKVTKGPADKPLAKYQVKIEGNSVLVKV
jgi:cytochrome b6-f complex iron-sulfur subunit